MNSCFLLIFYWGERKSRKHLNSTIKDRRLQSTLYFTRIWNRLATVSSTCLICAHFMKDIFVPNNMSPNSPAVGRTWVTEAERLFLQLQPQAGCTASSLTLVQSPWEEQPHSSDSKNCFGTLRPIICHFRFRSEKLSLGVGCHGMWAATAKLPTPATL